MHYGFRWYTTSSSFSEETKGVKLELWKDKTIFFRKFIGYFREHFYQQIRNCRWKLQKNTLRIYPITQFIPRSLNPQWREDSRRGALKVHKPAWAIDLYVRCSAGLYQNVFGPGHILSLFKVVQVRYALHVIW